jgi:UDP-N-acetyl-D-mannosaminuronate dehydrogenase
METPVKKICVVGLGYIGLPTSSMFASHGYAVHGVDINPKIIDTLRAGNIHIEEPGLATVVKAAINSGNLTVNLKPVEADVFIIAVPTPITPDHAPDLSMVEAAARSIAPVVKAGNLVILESTSPVGTTDEIVSRHIDEPAFTLTHGGDAGSTGNSAQIRAFLVDGDNATSHSTQSPPCLRCSDAPERGDRPNSRAAVTRGICCPPGRKPPCH